MTAGVMGAGMVRMLWVLAIVGLIGLALGYCGAIHPAGDSFAVFRRQFAGGAVIVSLILLFLGRRAAAVLLASVLGAATTYNLSDPHRHEPDLRLYQKNLSFRLQDTRPLLADIRATSPDIVTLQEVSSRLLPILSDLADEYPGQAFCPFYDVMGGVAVLSRWPVSQVRCRNRQGMVAAYIESPEGPFWAVSIHLHWPWPHRQAGQVVAILPVLARLEGPVVIGGDFNMVPWGNSIRRIAGAAKTGIAAGPFNTFARFQPWAPLPIDHVLAPSGGKSLARPHFGSDHKGLLAQVHF